MPPGIRFLSVNNKKPDVAILNIITTDPKFRVILDKIGHPDKKPADVDSC